MRAALVGLGMVAQTHIRALADASETVQLAGICARDAHKAQSFATEAAPWLGYVPNIYPNADAIAADDSVDFVVICTPPNARLELIETFTRAGKHILLEKPVEREARAALEIVEICEAAGVTLGVVFQHRMRQASRHLADMLKEGGLGKVALAEISVPWWRDQSYYDEPGRGTYARDGGGVLISQAIHTLDLALALLGPVTKVQALARTTALHDMESEDIVQAGFDFASGAFGVFNASTASFPGRAETITLHCEKGSVTLGSGQLVTTWRDGRKNVLGATGGTGGGADPMAFTHAWHRDILMDFAHALSTGRPPVVSGREALKVHRLIDAIIASSKSERAVEVSKET